MEIFPLFHALCQRLAFFIRALASREIVAQTEIAAPMFGSDECACLIRNAACLYRTNWVQVNISYQVDHRAREKSRGNAPTTRTVRDNFCMQALFGQWKATYSGFASCFSAAALAIGLMSKVIPHLVACRLWVNPLHHRRVWNHSILSPSRHAAFLFMMV